MQSKVQLACQACFQQFKRNRNCELTTYTKRVPANAKGGGGAAWAQRPIAGQLSRDHPENHPPPGKDMFTGQNQQIQTAIWHFQCEI